MSISLPFHQYHWNHLDKRVVIVVERNAAANVSLMFGNSFDGYKNGRGHRPEARHTGCYIGAEAEGCASQRRREGLRVMLSQTARGINWVQNFPAQDQTIATRLLDAFMLLSWSSARTSLLALLQQRITLALDAGPVWVLPLAAREDIWNLAVNLWGKKPVAFENYEPGAAIAALPGSEGLIGHLVRDVQGPGVLAPGASLDALRESKVRTVIVVTDAIETGSQVKDYADTLMANPTLRSWRSFKWIRVEVVAFAVSRDAQVLLERRHNIDRLDCVHTAPAIQSLPWNSEDIAAATRLCEDFARGKTRLGYKDHGGLFGFQDRVPNTVPKIFTQTPKNWSRLFEGRKVPSDISQALDGDSLPPVDHPAILTSVHQRRLAQATDRQMRRSNRDIIAVLALVLARSVGTAEIGAALGATQEEVEGLLRYMRNQGWITGDNEITVDGRAELAAGKHQKRRVKTDTVAHDPRPYYPRSLR